jgi:hypothetical protein
MLYRDKTGEQSVGRMSSNRILKKNIKRQSRAQICLESLQKKEEKFCFVIQVINQLLGLLLGRMKMIGLYGCLPMTWNALIIIHVI